MQYKKFARSAAALLFAVAFLEAPAVFSQGFDNYVAPQQGASQARATATRAAKPTQQARGVQKVAMNQTQAATTQAPAAAPAAQQQTAQAPAAAQGQAAQPTATPQGGYVSGSEANNAYVNPPENYKPTEKELAQLDEFLKKWEEHGKNIKRVSCNVHMREFDSVIQQDAKRPVAHTWGEFRFITPNKLSYHVKGEFEYSDANPKGEWKESQNEWQVVLDGRSFTQYDYKNKKAVVYPIPEDEQDIDLTMDNGQFPLFFVAKAETLKSRFYLRIVTPETRQKNEVWIEAFPRYARDAQQFQSIMVLLRLKDLQPTYMRKVAANGKSKTDLTFEEIAVNKGLWSIDGSVDQGWTKDVREEQFSILRQQTIVGENGTVATLVTDPKDFPSNKKPKDAQANQAQAKSAQTQQAQSQAKARQTRAAQTNASAKRF